MSGQSAGLVVTLAGRTLISSSSLPPSFLKPTALHIEIVSEGHLNWTLTPWLRRLVTRTIAVVPCIIVAASVGRSGLSAVLNASQVALSVVLPVVSAPLIWFTCSKAVMSVEDVVEGEDGQTVLDERRMVDLSNSWAVTILGGVVWLFITALNFVSRLLRQIEAHLALMAASV